MATSSVNFGTVTSGTKANSIWKSYTYNQCLPVQVNSVVGYPNSKESDPPNLAWLDKRVDEMRVRL